jgi:hypothetical protein
MEENTVYAPARSEYEEFQRLANGVVDNLVKEMFDGKEMSYSKAVQVLETARHILGERQII